MKDEGLFGRGGKSGGGRVGVEKGGGEKAKGGKVRVEKVGGSGCCNTATYSTGEGGKAMERKVRRKRRKEGRRRGWLL